MGGVSDPALWKGICKRVFQIDGKTLHENIEATNAFYGGADPSLYTNVFFSNGQHDPWSALGIRSTNAEDTSRGVEAVVGQKGSHCVGLYSAKKGGGFDGGAQVRNAARSWAGAWIDTWAAAREVDQEFSFLV